MTIVAFLIMTAFAGLMVQVDDDREPAPSVTQTMTPARTLYTAHSPISITGNAEFSVANGVIGGNGSSSNPYIIRGWEIVAGVSDFAAVFISESDAFFRLEDCHLTHSDGNAVQLDYVSNGILINNTCTESLNGIGIAFSNSNTIANNTLSHNDYHGIFMSASDGNVILGNNCSYNSYYGIWLGVSDYNAISDNTCSWHTTSGLEMNSGIYLDSSSTNTLTNNSCLGNTWGGISVYGSSGNIMADNECQGNRLHGIGLTSSNSNVLNRNNCSDSLESNMTGPEGKGISLGGSSWNTLTDNICTNNTDIGIAILASARNTLTNNDCANNSLAGIYIDSWDQSAQWNILANSTCRGNAYGIMLWQWSSNNTLVGNNCSENIINGIFLAYSRDNFLTNNSCTRNLEYGLCVINGESSIRNYVSRNNTIWNNTFTGNNGASGTYDPSHVQAYDGGSDNRWNSTEGYGNWWSDWSGPDADMNGIVDLPYNVNGSAGARDYYPRTSTQVPIPEFGMMPLVVMMLLAMAALTRKLRR